MKRKTKPTRGAGTPAPTGKPAPTWPPVNSWPRALAWAEDNRDLWKGEWKTAREALYWFVSFQEAALEDLRQKDIAWFFLHGIPKASIRSCRVWIADARRDWEAEREYAPAQGPFDLRPQLEEFWGVAGADEQEDDE
jgi:hypothetical protein